MKQHEVMALLRRQAERYPLLEVQDLAKALYQAEFGCGHFVAPGGDGEARLLRELSDTADASRRVQPPLVEPLGEGFCRVHLPALQESGLAPKTLHRLFYLSAKEPAGSKAQFLQSLDVLEDSAEQYGLKREEARAWLASYRAAGCPATHHSDAFRAVYVPAYRVIAVKYARLIPLLERLDGLLQSKERVLLAIEGRSASGKTTLAAALADIYEDSTVFHMDDYFLRPEQRTLERLAEPGGNVDRERFAQEVLLPVTRGELATVRAYDCATQTLGEARSVAPGRLVIVEGVYSMHPELAGVYDLSLFLHVNPGQQAQRILARNGTAMARRFANEWIPMENLYFSAMNTPARCTLQMGLT